jgi:hypothetical protein
MVASDKKDLSFHFLEARVQIFPPFIVVVMVTTVVIKVVRRVMMAAMTKYYVVFCVFTECGRIPVKETFRSCKSYRMHTCGSGSME